MQHLLWSWLKSNKLVNRLLVEMKIKCYYIRGFVFIRKISRSNNVSLTKESCISLLVYGAWKKEIKHLYQLKVNSWFVSLLSPTDQLVIVIIVRIVVVVVIIIIIIIIIVIIDRNKVVEETEAIKIVLLNSYWYTKSPGFQETATIAIRMSIINIYKKC